MASGITISGSVLRALRNDRLWSQAELASRSGAFARAEGERQCGITREGVSKLERGIRSPSPRTLRYLIGALRPTMEQLRRLLGQEPPRALATLTQDADESWRQNSDAFHRRVLLSSLAAVAVASPHDTLQRIARALDRPARVDACVLDALLVQSGRLGVSALGLGPAPVIRAAVTHLHGIERLIEFSMANGERPRLQAVNADAAALVGWLSWLLDRRAEAAHAMSSATRLARESGDRLLQARVLGLLSWMASPIPTGGQRGDAATARSLAMRAAAAARG
ncbi:MAG: helix-turn-helix domain-containing protein, partial [Egibacteraceae bacterium]